MKEGKGFMPLWIQDGFVKLLMPLINLFIKWKVNPNFFTVLGFIFSLTAALVIMNDPAMIHWGGGLIILGGICDIIDGKVARATGKSTQFGALFDSVVDRYSEMVMFFAVAVYYVKLDNYLFSIVTIIAFGGATMVSYVRARAEALGLPAKVGIMQRPERVVLVGVTALFHVFLLKIGIWAIAILANYTAIQRLIYAYRASKSTTKQED
jgi:CDP-diacylglycerol--glycerol-3-phosphate 3-phosphatidyltransferase